MAKGLTLADFPELLTQWHPIKNGNITPEDVIAGSHKKYWWKCSKDHEWESSCDKRIGNKRGCPFCSNNKVCHDNCLETCFPDIAKEWHPTKNNDITPKDVIPGSHKKYWWKCSKGIKDHEWEASSNDRTGNKKSGCPYCSNHKVCHNNCLATCFPEIAKEWHSTKNGTITPKDVVYGSDKKYWWRCSKDHEWEARCSDRTGSNKCGCPYCSNKKVCDDNCLATCFPDIAKEWHSTKNGNIAPKDVVSGSHKKYWWKCSKSLKDHEWQAACKSRTGSQKRGCPFCTNQKVCNDNCLATCFPEIAKEWHPTKNGDITPKDIIPGSDKKYWWICPKGFKDHEWKASCNSRTGKARPGCPYCSNHKVCHNNCLATCFPEIAKEWHPTKNGNITPKDVVSGSNKKYWWKCSKGIKDHEWQASCSNRIGNGKTDCPYCNNKKVCDDNCLATCFPEIAKEWHPIKNGNITPKDVVSGSNKKYWWKCSKGIKDHEWQANCKNRTGNNKSGCPDCCSSRGEIKISEFLDKFNHKYTCEKRYDSCKNIKPLPFDFHINYNNSEVLIEYHGMQHYMPSNFGSQKNNVVLKNFREVVKRDYIKESWCKENQIKLLVIPYWNYERIEEILTSFFAGKEIVFSEPPKEIKKYVLKRDKITQKLIQNKNIK